MTQGIEEIIKGILADPKLTYPQRLTALAGAALTDPVTPQTQASVMLAEDLHDSVYLNQVEMPAAWAAAEELTRRLDCPVAAGSLHQGVFRRLR